MAMKLTAPDCHWGGCTQRNRTMDLINETADFWFFAHGCGTTRAVSKPSVRAAASHAAAQRDIERIRQTQRIREASRKEYSLPSATRSTGGIIHG